MNLFINEDAQVGYNEKITREFEKEYIDILIEDVNKGNVAYIVALHEGKWIGVSHVQRKKFRQEHVGGFGILIAKGYRNIGIGTKMTEIILDLSRKNEKSRDNRVENIPHK